MAPCSRRNAASARSWSASPAGTVEQPLAGDRALGSTEARLDARDGRQQRPVDVRLGRDRRHAQREVVVDRAQLGQRRRAGGVHVEADLRRCRQQARAQRGQRGRAVRRRRRRDDGRGLARAGVRRRLLASAAVPVSAGGSAVAGAVSGAGGAAGAVRLRAASARRRAAPPRGPPRRLDGRRRRLDRSRSATAAWCRRGGAPGSRAGSPSWPSSAGVVVVVASVVGRRRSLDRSSCPSSDRVGGGPPGSVLGGRRGIAGVGGRPARERACGEGARSESRRDQRGNACGALCGHALPRVSRSGVLSHPTPPAAFRAAQSGRLHSRRIGRERLSVSPIGTISPTYP